MELPYAYLFQAAVAIAAVAAVAQAMQPVQQPAAAIPAAAAAAAAPAAPAPNAAFAADMAAIKTRLLAYLSAPGNQIKVSVIQKPYPPPVPYLPYPPYRSYRIPLTVPIVSYYRSTVSPIRACPPPGTA